MSSLVDMAFLLLIYFLVTSTLLPKEGDLAMALGGGPGFIQIEDLEVALDSDGAYTVAGIGIGKGEAALPTLFQNVKDFKDVCIALGQEPVIIISAADQAHHQEFIWILNEIARAGVEGVMIRSI